jgi:hypothetical protein
MTDPVVEKYTAKIASEVAGVILAEMKKRKFTIYGMSRLMNCDYGQVKRFLDADNMELKTIVRMALALGYKPALRLEFE